LAQKFKKKENGVSVLNVLIYNSGKRKCWRNFEFEKKNGAVT
jgi:hypothetical protein